MNDISKGVICVFIAAVIFFIGFWFNHTLVLSQSELVWLLVACIVFGGILFLTGLSLLVDARR